MSANHRSHFNLEQESAPITGCVPLEIVKVTAEERAYFERRFGRPVEVDRVGRFYLVHRDAPAPQMRDARVADLRTSFRPTLCEHCAAAVSQGGLLLYESPRSAPKELRIVPVDRPSRAAEAVAT